MEAGEEEKGKPAARSQSFHEGTSNQDEKGAKDEGEETIGKKTGQSKKDILFII